MPNFPQMKLDEVASLMKGVGEVLVPYNFPLASFDPEDCLGILKSRLAVIDGYRLFLHFQKSDYGDYLVKTVQIHNASSPFLPFCLVCKVATAFLGTQNLTFIEFIRDSRRVYVWSVCSDKEGNSLKVPNVPENDHRSFGSLEFHQLYPEQDEL